MAKITVCDVCLTRHNKITRSGTHINVKGHRDLRLDVCNVHRFEVHNKFNGATVEFAQFVYKMAHGKELSAEDAKNVLRKKKKR